MKKIYIGSTLLALMLSGQSCSENYDIYPEEYAKVVMIKDAGENPLSVYSTDDKVGHKFVVMKGGHTEEAATATLRAMTSEEFTTYQAESGKPYAMLPADCYSFSADGQTTSAEIKFAPNETYKEVEVFINADALGTFMETFDGSLYSPVVPVILESSDASVNSYGTESFILPTYSEPTLLISGPAGSNNTFSLGQLGDGKFSATVTLPIPNQWDITYQVAIDEAVVGRYNAANGTSYVSIDPAAISGETTFTLPAGTNSMDISLNIDPSYISDRDVVVPLRIVSTNVDGIDPDDAQGWTLGTTRIALTVDMLSSNAVEPTEGSLANLLDGDPSTYFHSNWSTPSTVSGAHYLQINLPAAYSWIQIEYGNRISASTNTPAWFNFYTGTSNADLTLFKAYAWDTDGLNGDSGAFNLLAPVSFSTPQSVFRIENTDSWNGNVFFVMTELAMWGY